MRIFKIRNPQGLFSTGGSRPTWTPKGKTWVALNHIRAHLTLIREERSRFTALLLNPITGQRYEATRRYATYDKSKDPYLGCVVVEFETIEKGIMPIKEGIAS
jgi:hypothetical protein